MEPQQDNPQHPALRQAFTDLAQNADTKAPPPGFRAVKNPLPEQSHA